MASLYDCFSMIRPIGYSNSGSCGYCHGEPPEGNTTNRYSYYATTRSIDPDFYQSLLDRCWRRSGTLLYRPNQRDSCCPHYTIRLDAAAFHATKDQRQTINRFNRFVAGDAYTAEAARACPRSRKEAKQRDTVFDLAERIHEAEHDKLPPLARPRPGPKKARKGEGDKAEGDKDSKDTAAPTEEPEPVRPAHHFSVSLETDVFTEEKYLVFENYQRLVHKEPPEKISRDGFRSFLCDSPLRRERYLSADLQSARSVGSYHQVYRLDGRVVAVGVLDLLPACVSAVYFFYHESIHQHSPGKLGALREIALAREGGYGWWYSGFYIHGCPKMRYKIDFAPQYMLDPATLDWHLLDKAALALLDQKPYVSLSREKRRRQRQQRQRQQRQQRQEQRDGDARDGGAHDNGNENGNENDGSAHDDRNGNDSDSDSDGPGDGPGVPPADDGDQTALLASSMPSLPPLHELEAFDYSEVPVALRGPDEVLYAVTQLPLWSAAGSVAVGDSLKGKIAELVAMVGVDLMPRVCLDFR